MAKSTGGLKSKLVLVFHYRGFECEVRQVRDLETLSYHNGYLTGSLSRQLQNDYDYEDYAEVHGGWTYLSYEEDGRVTLGFDTMHGYSRPEHQTASYVEGELRSAVDQLYQAEIVERNERACAYCGGVLAAHGAKGSVVMHCPSCGARVQPE